MSKAKIISKRSEDNIVGEKNILSKINHPFIVNMHFSFQDSNNLYLIMDYLSGGDLRYHLSHKKSPLFNENQARFFISNIIIALEYIHSQKIIHRDVKPENLILDDNGYLRLTDFGIAVYSKKENMKESNGTAGYVAPEVLLQQGYNYSSDFFALGVIGYEFMQGTRPYYTQNRKQIKDLILVYQPKIKSNEIKKGWSENSRDFINKLLQRKPIKRLGYTGVRELKNHVWMKDINWDLLKKKKIKSPYIPKEGKEYYDKKYCEIDKTMDNNKLINVTGYQHAFEKYTYINLNYISQFITIKKEDKDKKDDKENINLNKDRQILSESSNKQIYKNQSTSLLKLIKKNYYNKKNLEKAKINKINHFRNKKEIKNDFKGNYSSYNNEPLYKSNNNNLRRYYDLGITKKNEEKNLIKEKNNSCRLFNRGNKDDVKDNEKNEFKNRITPKGNKKLQSLKLINKYSKNIEIGKSKKNKIIFNYNNKTSNNDNINEQHIYSTTKKTTKEKTTNTMTDNQKKDEIIKLNKKLNVINLETKHSNENNLKYSKKKSVNDFKYSKRTFSKSQILINFKGNQNLKNLKDKSKSNNSKIQNNKKALNNKNNHMSDMNNKKNKRFISISIQNNHLKSSNNLSIKKKNQQKNNKSREKLFSANNQKVIKKLEKQRIMKSATSLNYKKTKNKSPKDSHKLKVLKFDDYFKHTGLIKESTKNNFYIIDKFKSII